MALMSRTVLFYEFDLAVLMIPLCFKESLILFTKKTVLRDLGIFKWKYIERASFLDPPPIFLKFLCCVIIELINLKDPMRLMQTTNLFPVPIGMPLANAS
jgi:hypothetical protein